MTHKQGIRTSGFPAFAFGTKALNLPTNWKELVLDVIQMS